jgi:hypothetical protein
MGRRRVHVNADTRVVMPRVRGIFVAPGIPVRAFCSLGFRPLPATNGKPLEAIVEGEIPGHFDKLGIVTRILI